MVMADGLVVGSNGDDRDRSPLELPALGVLAVARIQKAHMRHHALTPAPARSPT